MALILPSIISMVVIEVLHQNIFHRLSPIYCNVNFCTLYKVLYYGFNTFEIHSQITCILINFRTCSIIVIGKKMVQQTFLKILIYLVQWFLRRRFLNTLSLFLMLSNHLPFERGDKSLIVLQYLIPL